MQAISNSLISLNCFSKGDQSVTKIVAFCFPGNERCTLSQLTFDELLAQRVQAKLPCIVARVKDIEGKVHLFEGCAAATLGSFTLPGYFKATLTAEWKGCSYIQYFKLVSSTFANQQLFHAFQLERRDTFFTLHGEQFLSGKKPDFASAKKYLDKALKTRPNDARALQLLGKLFFYGQGVPQNRETAKDYFNRALAIDPQNKFVLNRMAELELPAHKAPSESENLVDQLDALSIDESSGTESEAPPETSETQGNVETMADEVHQSAAKEKVEQIAVASDLIVHEQVGERSLSAKKHSCDCALL